MKENITSIVHQAMQQSKAAFAIYKMKTAAERSAFLIAIADSIEEKREALVQIANEETNLPLARLNGEITRTTGQLKMFANLINEGSWVEAAIDTADANRTPPKPDIRKMLLPVGPVIVFGASNFPFAFSTAGGDTASVLAAGCTVVIKAHPAHAKTSALAFEAMQKAIIKTNMPEFTVQHLQAHGNDLGKELVVHPFTSAVGFTGSYKGGKALTEYAQQRETPIPVFAEMSSINPVVLLPETVANNNSMLAQMLAASVMLGAGQFCTNPGLMIAINGEGLDAFIQSLSEIIAAGAPQKMLHNGIYDSYCSGLKKIMDEHDVPVVSTSSAEPKVLEAKAAIAKVNAEIFLQEKDLQEEIFGPYSLLVVCTDKDEMIKVLQSLKGQLTATVMGTTSDFEKNKDIIELQTSLAGRVILNGAPTGVEVCAGMVHGGPWPAATDARFTSVGTGAIKRWVRPVCFQNFPDSLLPAELKNTNLLNIWRLVNNNFTKEVIETEAV